MKTTHTLASAITLVHNASANHYDDTVAIRDMRFSSLEQMTIAGQSFAVQPSAQRLLANRLRVPYSYLDRCPEDLQQENGVYPEMVDFGSGHLSAIAVVLATAEGLSIFETPPPALQAGGIAARLLGVKKHLTARCAQLGQGRKENQRHRVPGVRLRSASYARQAAGLRSRRWLRRNIVSLPHLASDMPAGPSPFVRIVSREAFPRRPDSNKTWRPWRPSRFNVFRFSEDYPLTPLGGMHEKCGPVRIQRPERVWDILLKVLGGRRFLVDTGRYEAFGSGVPARNATPNVLNLDDSGILPIVANILRSLSVTTPTDAC